MTTVKHLQKDKRKLLTISVGCACSSSTNPPEAGGVVILRGGSFGIERDQRAMKR